MPSEPPSRQLQPDQNQPDLGERFPGCAKAIFCWHVLPPAVAEHQCIARLHGAIIRRGGRCQTGHPAAAAITHYWRDAAGLSMPNHEVSSPRSRSKLQDHRRADWGHEITHGGHGLIVRRDAASQSMFERTPALSVVLPGPKMRPLCASGQPYNVGQSRRRPGRATSRRDAVTAGDLRQWSSIGARLRLPAKGRCRMRRTR